MASTEEAEEEARLRAVGGDEAAKFRLRLRSDIELQLECATGMLFNAESHIVKAVYDGNNQGTKREIYDAHNGEVSAVEVAEYICKCDEINPPIPGCVVHDDQGKPR
ncbi:hypothetical protein R1sor_022296 [Riccia sorocarpa]|uniref:Uncharacterized protein n=1 Tax=Riccia sorocarpa TaxID=122646 RepID=A0ABD3GMM1_9MARC